MPLALSVIVPAVLVLRTQAASWPPFMVIVAGPTRAPGPLTLNATELVSVGTTLAFWSTTSTKTKRASLASASIVVASGRSRMAADAPGVWRV